MRKRENHYLKKLFMALVMSTLLISCGQDNESGKKKRSSINPFGGDGYSYAGFASANGQNVNTLLATIGNQNPCVSTYGYTNNSAANNRVRAVVPLTNINVNAGAVHVGVTPEGDIGIVSRQGNTPVMEIYLCSRPDLTGQGHMTKQPALNTSFSCPVSEITAAEIALPTNSGFGSYLLQFAPIHIPNAGRVSQLCQ